MTDTFFTKDSERYQRTLHEETTKKLKYYYKSQDKLAPLFDDPEQSIDTCYIQLALLNQTIFRQRKEQWTSTLDYSLTYDTGQETVELQDIWNETDELEIHHIGIRGEAGSGKSVLTQRIAYLWANHQLWNDRFQWLLHIPFRKIAHIFDNNKKNIKYQWLKIMNELNIPQWITDDTDIVYSKNGLLILDGFDEIANELNQKPGMQKWLQYCIDNRKYSIIITSRPNAMCSYLKNPRLLNVIGFQSQDIQKYIHSYFQNISNDCSDHYYYAEMLIKKLNDNPQLKLLSHIPLYLRLFCYFTRQQIINEQKEKEDLRSKSDLNELNNIPISKLYKKFLECYMKWNWIKLNGTKNKLNGQDMFNTFEMEIDYLSHLAWEGLKSGQIIISCKIQQKVLNIIKSKYPREHISVMSQWSRINSFGFLQGQESMNPFHPIDSVYFPHLTFQEWFSAYYLVDCLYQSNETKEHQEVCSILMNEQFNPKYSTMIPFMAGMLYDNIENGKDRSGSGLLYFWKLLHSSPPQLTPINQMMLFVHCLDTCKADTESPFLSLKLKCYHETVINSFKSWLIAWINFGKNKYYTNRYMNRSLNKMMKTHLPTLQYVLVHRDIHSWIIDQLTQFKSMILEIQKKSFINNMRFGDEFSLLPYLCISTETLDIVLQCFEASIRYDLFNVDIARLYGEASMKLKEDQLDSVLKFLTIALFEKKKYDKAIWSLKAIVPKLNERQANDVFQFLMNKKEIWNYLQTCLH
ncbi:NACHT family NTPase [Reticulomyxa filosa]|uniref:NACHT family NTPase n=1 Tax=Reticulomyxa filosa TaxID=46433 RepID=X6LQM1_RETFI|nr:NACHT family NTPase [Reticulomyxa filosa]|eukprot:ETO03427.1 NACHT family NTPase [Reticulomyxa filosa]